MKTVVLFLWFPLHPAGGIHSHEFFDLPSCEAAAEAIISKAKQRNGHVPAWVCADNPLTTESKE